MKRLMIFAAIALLLMWPLMAFAQQPCVNGVCPLQATAVMSPAVPQTMESPGPVFVAQDRPRLFERFVDRAREFNASRPKLFGGRCR